MNVVLENSLKPKNQGVVEGSDFDHRNTKMALFFGIPGIHMKKSILWNTYGK
jgi:hypothetical protein